MGYTWVDGGWYSPGQRKGGGVMPMRNKVAESVEKLGACDEAVEWLDAEDFPTLQAAWNKCHRADWMMWLVIRLVRREGGTPRNKLVSIAVQFARLSLRHVRDKTARAAIAQSLDTTEAWVRGERTIEEVSAAAAYYTYAADAATNAAAYYAYAAAHAATNAIYAATNAIYAATAVCAAADAVHAAAATMRDRDRCADIVRAVLPIAPSLG